MKVEHTGQDTDNTFPHSLKGQRYGGLHARMSSMKELRSKSSVIVLFYLDVSRIWHKFTCLISSTNFASRVFLLSASLCVLPEAESRKGWQKCLECLQRAQKTSTPMTNQSYWWLLNMEKLMYRKLVYYSPKMAWWKQKGARSQGNSLATSFKSDLIFRRSAGKTFREINLFWDWNIHYP